MTFAGMRRPGWIREIADLFFPRACIGCGGPPDAGFKYLCWDCLAETEWLQPPMCSRCGEPVAGRIDHTYECYLCGLVKRHFDLARSASRYDGVVAEAMQTFKYSHSIWMADDLAFFLLACVEVHYEVGDFDGLVPVPLHATRRRARGFNQAEVLAQRLGRLLDKPVLRGVLRRIRHTPSQTNLTARQRTSNVKDAFSTRKNHRLQGQKLLLLDDIMTTGATVNECALMLKRGGADRVDVVTVARG